METTSAPLPPAAPPAPAPEPVLRTLAPALRRLEKQLRAWMDGPRFRSLSTLTQATLEGLAADLGRSAAALDVDRPLLVIAFMGGTGVGKSTLLNALARGQVAHASFTRPTTRAPVVYYHESVKPDRLDPALQQCKLVAHDRPGLEQKILVDTPDLDSNEGANRERLKAILPIADVVLYVGSQEKYHDQMGWDLFLEQRRRRAFAFVLNKWDRCLHGAGSGVRPDEDLLRDLREQGFENPLLFRTCAQLWVDENAERGARSAERSEGPGSSALRAPRSALPEGEQFRALETWLEAGLTRLEIEAIKARGVSQLLAQLGQALAAAKPPDLTEAAGKARKAWERKLGEEAQAMSDILLATVDPHQHEIEQHFALEGHRRFHGLMAGFLSLATRFRYFGVSWKQVLPAPLRTDLAEAAAKSAWDLASFSRACSGLAADRHLDARGRALADALLLQADQEGFPVALLHDAAEGASRANWRQRYAAVLIEVLHEAEGQWAKPTGPRRVVQTALVWLGDLLPLTAFAGSAGFLLYKYYGQGHAIDSIWEPLLLPPVSVFLSLTLLYIVITLALPIRWPAIRGTFHRKLTARLKEELNAGYLPLPGEVAKQLAAERKQIEDLAGDCREVEEWLRQREQSAQVAGLYGS